MTDLGRVTIGSQHHGVVFDSVMRSDSRDPYAGDSFTARLVGEGISATRVVFMFRHDWENLASFFADLAAAWKGVDGFRTYRSVESDLEIRVTSDSQGHNHFGFVLRDGPTPSWSATLKGIEVASGEDTASLARTVANWAQARN